jgi:hypothetical protein
MIRNEHRAGRPFVSYARSRAIIALDLSIHEKFSELYTLY